jgi:single-stranded-DNA-specific exonuclease
VQWKFAKVDKYRVRNISEGLGISELVATIIVNNGIADEATASRFIFPKLSDISDPFIITNMDRAVEMLDRHIQANSDISVIGDYDVDGITGVAFFMDIMHRLGVYPKFFIPRRFTEGYGISDEIVTGMLKESNKNLWWRSTAAQTAPNKSAT